MRQETLLSPCLGPTRFDLLNYGVSYKHGIGVYSHENSEIRKRNISEKLKVVEIRLGINPLGRNYTITLNESLLELYLYW